MKTTLRKLVVSLIFAVLGMIWLVFTLTGYQGLDSSTVIWYWFGGLMVHISLSALISVYLGNTVYSIFFKMLLLTSIIAFNVALLGIFVGVMLQNSGNWNTSIMMWYWILILILYLISIIALVSLAILNPNNSYYTRLCKNLMILNIILNLGPVLWTVFFMIIGNAMNSVTPI
ncbi:DUF3902 family protein [Bacillus thuringiensis]|uniref:Group-specific protein n=2 Tax=Bacillus thuringiensis TaxID=1428 RepID=A0A9W3J7T5_BACTU|nr:DUF3902 family protein [Bacillus thuringiensis]EEM37674.1 hypothetical protein bthur0004_65290 [Bacillus thuringiensis serovar sotto str. T04001]AFQ15706.1 hypothetical protein BTG_11240 [Bacillus thuringiensis HD-771]MEB4894572.1 DUF3902 family protein [Bacillus thuringiensis]MEC2475109.1 DUF3902 family protein [Bacillus thuringiensis]MEC2727550.1 DUF3902 family protein [Bacillus thuringiensis]